MRKTTISAAEKASVIAACERLTGEFMKPRFLPVIQPTEFNYPVDILGKWRGACYRFIVRYRSGFPDNPGEEFDVPFARLDWIGRGRRLGRTWAGLGPGAKLARRRPTLYIRVTARFRATPGVA